MIIFNTDAMLLRVCMIVYVCFDMNHLKKSITIMQCVIFKLFYSNCFFFFVVSQTYYQNGNDTLIHTMI